MSIYISRVLPYAVFLLTDGAELDEFGNLYAIRTKVHHAEGVSFAVTGAGHTQAVDMIAERLCTAAAKECAAQVIGNLQAVADRIHAEIGDDYDGRYSKISAEFVICAYSPGWGGAHRFMSTVPKGSAPADAADRTVHAPWEVYVPDGSLFGRCPSPMEMISAGIPPLNPQAENPWTWFRRFGADIVEIERRKKHPTFNGEHHIIGGHCDLTKIDALGVSTERLRTWPDKIGERIDPFRLAPAAGMNRKQRRATAAGRST